MLGIFSPAQIKLGLDRSGAFARSATPRVGSGVPCSPQCFSIAPAPLGSPISAGSRRTPRARDPRARRRHPPSRGAGLGELRGRVHDPLGRLLLGSGLCRRRSGSNGARRDVLAAADLRDPPSQRRRSQCARSRSISASASSRSSSRSSRSCSRSPSGPRRSPSIRSRSASHPSSSRRPHDPRCDHDAARRLARALACSGAARCRCDLPARRRPCPSGAADLLGPISGAGFITAGVLAAFVFDRSPHQTLLIAESMSRDRLRAFTQVLVAGFGLAAVLLSWGDRRRDHWASTTRFSPRPAAGWRSSSRPAT